MRRRAFSGWPPPSASPTRKASCLIARDEFVCPIHNCRESRVLEPPVRRREWRAQPRSFRAARGTPVGSLPLRPRPGAVGKAAGNRIADLVQPERRDDCTDLVAGDRVTQRQRPVCVAPLARRQRPLQDRSASSSRTASCRRRRSTHARRASLMARLRAPAGILSSTRQVSSSIMTLRRQPAIDLRACERSAG